MAARFRLAIQCVAPSICQKLSKFNPSRDRRRIIVENLRRWISGSGSAGSPTHDLGCCRVGKSSAVPLQVRGEFEYVKAKPLGDGFTGVPVREIRGAALENRMSIGLTFCSPAATRARRRK